MKKRVLIVEPRGVEANVFDRYMKLPLLGPLYLGTILRNNGFDVRVISENLIGRELSLSEMDADFLLLSCLTCTVERGYELAMRFKRQNPGGKVIIGGPHVSFMTEEASRYVDHVVIGEGEEIITDLLKYGSDETVVKGTPVKDLDSIPIPDYSLLAGVDRLQRVPIITSRGCPFDCEFCSVTEMFGRRYRMASVDRVIEEVKRAGHVEVFFSDDNFAANHRRTHKLLDAMLRNNIRVNTWSTQVRADVAKDVDLVEKMRRAGCSRVYVGFESVNQLTLDSLHKSQTIREMVHAIELFHKHRMRVHGMFILGNDEDREESVRDTLEFIHRHRIDSAQFLILTPFPGTRTFERLQRDGRLLHQMWRYYDAMHVVFRPSGCSPLELQHMMLDSFEDFYSIAGAMNEGLTAVFESLISLGKATAGYVLKPTRVNAAIRLGGSMLVRRWRQENQEYLRYLEQAVPAN